MTTYHELEHRLRTIDSLDAELVPTLVRVLLAAIEGSPPNVDDSRVVNALRSLQGQTLYVSSGDITVGKVTGKGIAIGHGAQATVIEFNLPPPTAAPMRVPDPVGDFVGRSEEITRMVQTLSSGSTAAISGIRGMGGIGKSQLALVVAQRLRGRYSKQILVALQGATEQPVTPERALQTVIQHFEPTAKLPDDVPSLIGIYQGCLEQHQQQTGEAVFILADDARDKQQVEPLMPSAGCALLITSRNTFTLPGMQRFDLGMLSQQEAEALLLGICERITEHAPELAKLCGYLPLALRVSAELLANDDTRPVARYLEQLQQERLKHLADPDQPDDPAASVEASLALSYAALPPEAQQTFAQLGVFAGDFTLEAAEAVVEHTNDATPLPDTLGLLRRRSLLEYDQDIQRYDLHDLVRAFALSRLHEQRPTRLRHAQYYVQVCWECDRLYKVGNETTVEGLALFDRERRQIDAGWQWTMKQRHSNDTDLLLLDFASATAYVGYLRYHMRHDRIPQLEAALDAARRLEDKEAEGMALGNLGSAYLSLDKYHQAIYYYEQDLAIRLKINDQRGAGNALGNLGMAYDDTGNYHSALHYYQQQLDITRKISDQVGESNALNCIGITYYHLGDYDKAIAYHDQAHTIAYKIGNLSLIGSSLGNLGNSYAALGKYAKSIEYTEQYLTIARKMSDRRSECEALGNLGGSYIDLGEYPRAIYYLQQQLEITYEIGNLRGVGIALGNLGQSYHHMGDYQQAIDSYEQARAIDQKIDTQEGVARHSWNLGKLHEQQGDLTRAVDLMQIEVDFKRQIGHADTEKYAAYLEQVTRRLAEQQAKLH